MVSGDVIINVLLIKSHGNYQTSSLKSTDNQLLESTVHCPLLYIGQEDPGSGGDNMLMQVCLFNSSFSIQVYLYSAFYNTIVAKPLYRKLSLYNRFIYCRNLIYFNNGTIWLILYTL